VLLRAVGVIIDIAPIEGAAESVHLINLPITVVIYAVTALDLAAEDQLVERRAIFIICDAVVVIVFIDAISDPIAVFVVVGLIGPVVTVIILSVTHLGGSSVNLYIQIIAVAAEQRRVRGRVIRRA